MPIPNLNTNYLVPDPGSAMLKAAQVKNYLTQSRYAAEDRPLKRELLQAQIENTLLGGRSQRERQALELENLRKISPLTREASFVDYLYKSAPSITWENYEPSRQHLQDIASDLGLGNINLPTSQDIIDQAFEAGKMPKDYFNDLKLRTMTSIENQVKIANAAKPSGYKPQSLEELKEIRGAGKTSVTVQTGQKSFQKLGEEMASAVVDDYKEVSGTAKALADLQSTKKLLESGIISGFGANWILGAGKALQRVGIDLSSDPIANTEAFAALMGNQVGRIIKQFGAGTGLSDADREYAEKIVGGKITLNEQSIKKIMAINEKAMKNVIQNYNKKAEEIMSKPESKDLLYDLRVSVPETTGGSGLDAFWE